MGTMQRVTPVCLCMVFCVMETHSNSFGLMAAPTLPHSIMDTTLEIFEPVCNSLASQAASLTLSSMPSAQYVRLYLI